MFCRVARVRASLRLVDRDDAGDAGDRGSRRGGRYAVPSTWGAGAAGGPFSNAAPTP